MEANVDTMEDLRVNGADESNVNTDSILETGSKSMKYLTILKFEICRDSEKKNNITT